MVLGAAKAPAAESTYPAEPDQEFAGAAIPRLLGRLSKVLRDAYSAFAAAFRIASERLRSGDRGARFPEGCFPPALPFSA